MNFFIFCHVNFIDSLLECVINLFKTLFKLNLMNETRVQVNDNNSFIEQNKQF